MAMTEPAIDSARLRALLDGINRFGAGAATAGHNRPGYSAADMDARRWFADTMRADGLAVRMDAVANVFGRFGPADGPAILAGSHLDTVTDGGAFDGALGVAVALEAVRALKSAGHMPRTAIEVVATAEEEGRFGGMLGSQAMAGIATPDWIAAARDAGGIALTEALRGAGLAPGAVQSARRDARDIRAFVEVHIEQGPVLERLDKPVGLVTAISGVCVLQVTLSGQANHSGTTPMDLRADAFAGLAAIAAAVPGIIDRAGGPESRITIGKVDLAPNDVHTIPGRAEFSVVLRDTDAGIMTALRQAFDAEVHRAATAHHLSVQIAQRSHIAPVALDPDLRRLMSREASALGIDAIEMPSGAGHDAQTMQSLCPSALIFTPSRGGISHAPEEFTDWRDIETAAALCLRVLQRLSSEAP